MKLFVGLSLCLCFSIYSIAQNAPVDFEPLGNGASWNWAVFENDANPALEFVVNPDVSGVNTSSTVAKFTALQTGNPWAGCETEHGAGIGSFTLTPSTSQISIMVWKDVISDIGIKLVEPSSAALPEIKIANTLIGEWEEITFDFSAQEGILYDQIVVFPDFDLAGRTQDNVIYFDNITFGEPISLEEPMVAAPNPTTDPSLVISMFSNEYTDVAVDTWLTPWSSANQEDIQIAGNDTKKYDGLDFAGIETVGPNLIDASGMDFFHMDVWSPNVTTFRIKLVDFGADEAFDGGDDSEHELVFEAQAQNEWVSYTLPLSTFTGLSSNDNLAQLIISCIPVGAGVVYLDNVYYSSLPSSLTDIETGDFMISPNPANNNFLIKSNAPIDEINIYDIAGKHVLNKTSAFLNNTIDIETLPSGLYVVKALSGDKILSNTLIKE